MQDFAIVLRDGEGPPVGGMEKFAGFFLLSVGNLKRIGVSLTISNFLKSQ